MPRNIYNNLKKYLGLSIFGMQLILHIILGAVGWTRPFELFSLILLTANFITALYLYHKQDNLLTGIGVMFLIASHSLIGWRIAPDALTSGSLLVINILVLYTGIKISENLSRLHFIIFAVSYFILFYLFIIRLKNAEAVFLLSLMGLAATARDFKLLSYFWALVLSFTFCQPYAWQAFILSFFFLKIIYSGKMKVQSASSLLFLACGLVFLFFVLFPVTVIVLEDDPRNFINILKEPEIQKALLTTAVTATFSTAVLAVFCIPLSYSISRIKFFGKPILLSFIDLPIIIPQSAAGIAILKVFGKQQYLGGLLFQTFGLRFDGTVLGICLAQIFVSMPFLMKSAISGFQSIPVSFEQNAQNLGAPPLSSFFRVTLPLASRSVFAGIILAWARAAGEFGAVLFISANPETAPIAVYNRFISLGIIQTAPLVTAIILFSILLFFLLQLTSRLLPLSGQKDEMV